MSYKTIDIALPGKYLDGRDRPSFRLDGKPSLPPNTEVRLLEAVGNEGYHRDGDRWVEYFDTRKREPYVAPALPGRVLNEPRKRGRPAKVR